MPVVPNTSTEPPQGGGSDHGAGWVVRSLGSRLQAATVLGCKVGPLWGPGRPTGVGNLGSAAFGGQTARFWPFGPEGPDVCLLSQTSTRDGRAAAIPAVRPCSRVVGGVRGVHPPGGRSRPLRGRGRLLREELGPLGPGDGYGGPRGTRGPRGRRKGPMGALTTATRWEEGPL